MSANNEPRVMVCQHGARRRYAIPRLLEEAGMLEALYTDSCEHSLLGKIAKAMGPLAKSSLKRLANRKIADVPKEKVFTTDVPTYKYYMGKKGKSQIENYLLIHESMNEQLIKFGTHNADILYCFEGENLGFIKYAKERGLRIILDVCINPLGGRILQSEKLKFKAFLISNNSANEYIRFRERYFISQASVADILLCPSEFVANGIKELTPEYDNKIRICPYGSSIYYNGRLNRPVKGRFFWAGGDWIRKGLHYLAEAADGLKKKYPAMEFRAAGITDPKVTEMKFFYNITFLGKLNIRQMQEEYLSADAFVFPTLSEGMAGVAIEALAAGCPVITTKAAGIDEMQNDRNGLIIDITSKNGLYSALEDLYLNDHKRNIISRNSRILANNFTETAWGKRLIEILTNR